MVKYFKKFFSWIEGFIFARTLKKEGVFVVFDLKKSEQPLVITKEESEILLKHQLICKGVEVNGDSENCFYTNNSLHELKNFVKEQQRLDIFIEDNLG